MRRSISLSLALATSFSLSGYAGGARYRPSEVKRANFVLAAGEPADAPMRTSLPPWMQTDLEAEGRRAKRAAAKITAGAERAALAAYREGVLAVRENGLARGIPLIEQGSPLAEGGGPVVAAYEAAEADALRAGARVAKALYRDYRESALRRAEAITARYADRMEAELQREYGKRLRATYRRYGRQAGRELQAKMKKAIALEKWRLAQRFYEKEARRELAELKERARAAGHSKYLAREAVAYRQAEASLAAQAAEEARREAAERRAKAEEAAARMARREAAARKKRRAADAAAAAAKRRAAEAEAKRRAAAAAAERRAAEAAAKRRAEQVARYGGIRAARDEVPVIRRPRPSRPAPEAKPPAASVYGLTDYFFQGIWGRLPQR